MSKLAAIIRYRRWQLDEERRGLVALEMERDTIIHQINALAQEIAEQRKLAGSDVAAVTLGAYIEGARIKQAWLDDALRKKDDEITEKQDVVAEAFRELKTFEVAEENQLAALKKREADREQQELDERGLQAFYKNKKVL